MYEPSGGTACSMNVPPRRHMYVRLVPMRMMGSRTHARTRAVFFEEGGFLVFLSFSVNVVVTCMYAWRRGRRGRRRRERDDDDVFHVFEPGGRAHVAEKYTGEVVVV